MKESCSNNKPTILMLIFLLSIAVILPFGIVGSKTNTCIASPESEWSYVDIPGLPENSAAQSVWTNSPDNVYVWENIPNPEIGYRDAHLYHWDGSSWNAEIQLTGCTGNRIYGTGSTDIFASASFYDIDTSQYDTRMYHFDGTGWLEQSLPLKVTHPLLGIIGEENNIYAHEYYETLILKYDGIDWQIESDLLEKRGMAYISADEIWGTGCWGHLLWDGSSWTHYSGFDFCDVHEMWGMRDESGNLHLYSVGANNFSNGIRIWRFAEDYPGSLTGSWGSKYGTFFSDPTGYGYRNAGCAYGIWGSGPNDVYVVGGRDSGVDGWYASIYHYDGSSFTKIMTTEDASSATDVWGTGPDDVWVSLNNGRLLHYGPVNVSTNLDMGSLSETQYSDKVTASAILTDDASNPLEGMELSFRLEGEVKTATTDVSGEASVEYLVDEEAGTYPVTCSFAGEGIYLPSEDSSDLEVVKESITLEYDGDFTVRSDELAELSAGVVEEEDGSLGDIENAGNVIFRVYDPSNNLAAEETASITEVEPGAGTASAVIDPLPANLYTVKTSLAENGYYQAEEVVSELVSYDPSGGFITGGGFLCEGGSKTFAFCVKPSCSDPWLPKGHVRFVDRTDFWHPIKVISDEFTWLVIPEDEDIAYVLGTCTYGGEEGYSFFLTVEDLRAGCVNLDTIHIKVLDEDANLVYESQGVIDGGNIKIHR